MVQIVQSLTGLVLTFDNVRLALTASQTDETIPATGESDTGLIICETTGGFADALQFSADSGTTYESLRTSDQTNHIGTAEGRSVSFNGLGNSAARYKLVMTSDVATRDFMQGVTTVSSG